MFEQLALQIYKYIIEVEFIFLMEYKLNPFELDKYFSMLDFRFYLDTLTAKVEEKNKQKQRNMGGSNMMKMLISVRDMLNVMTMKE